jgi:hypothetical protein
MRLQTASKVLRSAPWMGQHSHVQYRRYEILLTS